MKRIWFIRHAESAANAGLPTTRPDTIPLTDKGMQQAQALADNLNDVPGLIIRTPYLRTQQTAKPLLDKFPQVPTEIWPFHEFDFLSPSQCAGTTVEERKPWVSDYWQRCDPHYVHGAGAESFAAFKSRIIGRLKQLEKSPYDFIIVFAHGHVMRAIWQYLITGNTLFDNNCMAGFRDKMTRLPVPNTAIFRASFQNDIWRVDHPKFDIGANDSASPH